METTLNRESASKVRLTVQATSDEVAPALDRAVHQLAHQVKVPGFRQGKVPRKLLETHIGRDALREATLREAIPELLGRAVEDQVLRPLAPPSVEVTSYDLDNDLTFDATVEVRPEIQLPPLDGLPASRPSPEATPEEIAEQLGRLQDRFAALEPVARPARRGDYALIDIHGTVHNKQVEQVSGTDELYEIGAGFPVAELDSELENTRSGDILKFNAMLPEGVGGEYGGKEITFQVLVKEIREKKLPALDDEFAKTASEFDTLDELRGEVADRIRDVKASRADAEVRTQLLEGLLEEVEVEAPETLVVDEMNFRFQRLQEQLRGAGLDVAGYLDQSGSTQEQLEADLTRQAERNVKAQLILEEIGRQQEFKVTEDELRAEVQGHAEALRTDAKKLMEQLSQGGRILTLAGDIIRRKALDFLVERADIKEEEPSADEPDTTPAADG